MENTNPDIFFLEELLSYQIAAEPSQGEDWHESYKSNPEVFELLLKSNVQSEKAILKAMRSIAERSSEFINWWNWTYYKANEVDDLLVDENALIWEDFYTAMMLALVSTLGYAIEAGGLLTEIETRIPIGFTQKDPRAIKLLTDGSRQLVTDLTKYTRQQVKNAILTSLDLGESQDQATNRIARIINNPKRAATIASTETVNFFTEGRLEAANKIVKEFDIVVMKTWRTTQVRPCKICQGLNGISVGHKELFPNGKKGPTAHPWCRCYLQLEVVADFEELKASEPIPTAGKWVTLKNGKRILIKPKKTLDNQNFVNDTVSGRLYMLSHTGNYTDGEKETIANYQKTMAYVNVNKSLRSDLVIDSEDRKIINDLDSAISKNSLISNTTLYRGAAFDKPMDLGDVFVDKGFISTSLYEFVGKDFYVDKKERGNGNVYLVKIKAKKGTNGVFPANITDDLIDEGEFVMQRNQSFRVTGKYFEDKYNVIEVETL
jgi:hypothetical protein